MVAINRQLSVGINWKYSPESKNDSDVVRLNPNQLGNALTHLNESGLVAGPRHQARHLKRGIADLSHCRIGRRTISANRRMHRAPRPTRNKRKISFGGTLSIPTRSGITREHPITIYEEGAWNGGMALKDSLPASSHCFGCLKEMLQVGIHKLYYIAQGARLKASEHESEAHLSIFIKTKLEPCRSYLCREECRNGRGLMRFPALGAQVEPTRLIPESETGMG